jgi:hypothetical protein
MILCGIALRTEVFKSAFAAHSVDGYHELMNVRHSVVCNYLNYIFNRAARFSRWIIRNTLEQVKVSPVWNSECTSRVHVSQPY